MLKLATLGLTVSVMVLYTVTLVVDIEHGSCSQASWTVAVAVIVAVLALELVTMRVFCSGSVVVARVVVDEEGFWADEV